MATNQLNSISIKGVAAWSEFIEDFMDPDTGDEGIRGEHYVIGTLRLWHPDGWSPGYFTNEGEDFWQFRPDYKERDS